MHRTSRSAALAALCLTLALGTGLASSVSAAHAEGVATPTWDPPQAVPHGDGRELPITGVFPDGTLVSVWDEHGRPEDDVTRIFRSMKPPGGSWTAPELFPVEDVLRLDSIVTLPGGGLQIGYVRTSDGEKVLVWNADGSLEPGGLRGSEFGVDLTGDAEGDVVAERWGRFHRHHGYDHLVKYYDGRVWQAAPTIKVGTGDIFVPGPGESVWMASYLDARRLLTVRSWSPGSSTWTLEWSRRFGNDGGRPPSFVSGLDLAVGAPGWVTLAFQEKVHGAPGTTIRVVSRRGARGWSRAAVLARVDRGAFNALTAPQVAAAGRQAEVVWTASASGVERGREVWMARAGSVGPDVRRLDVVKGLHQFQHLMLDVDLREDGDVLVTYLQQKGRLHTLTGWLGAHRGLEEETLVDDINPNLGYSALLIPGLAAVVSSDTSAGAVSRIREG